MLIDLIKNRHSIRKYTQEQITREDLEKILEAGNLAPNAGGGQRSMIVAIHNANLTRELGIMNMANFDRKGLLGSYVSKEQPSVIDDESIVNGFYGAPTVVAIFAQNNFMFKIADTFCIAENMLLQATELGISSCIISRGEETFNSDKGKALMNKWGVPENYTCQGFVILGYIDGKPPERKPRKNQRVKIID